MKRQNFELDRDDELEEDDIDEFDIDDDDDDDDDGIAKKLKKLKGKLDGVALAFLFVGFIGLLSLICGIFVGRNSDPGDYYGTYYTVFDSAYITYHISEEESYCEASCGFDLVDLEIIEFTKCEYLTASKAQRFIKNEEYEGCDALALYVSDNNAHVLWIVENSPYKFVLNANGAELTQAKYDFVEDMEDPRDYYCTYTYNENNKITFNKDGTADFCFNGVDKEYKFAFVNEDWNSKWMKNNNGCALVVYLGEDIHVFIYEDNKTLVYGKYEFTGTGSVSLPLPDDDSDADSDDGSNNTSNGTSKSPNWSKLLDYSNVTLETSQTEYGYTLYTLLKIKDGKYRYEISLSDDFKKDETEIYYTDGSNSYYSFDGEKETISKSDVMSMCKMLTDLIDSIEIDDITKINDTKYSTADATIYLDSSGNVKKIEFEDSITIEFSNHGSTTVSKP